MGSKILPQALVAVPRIPIQCPHSKKLGFHTSTPLGFSRASVSRVSRNPIITVSSRRRFVARAEEEPEAAGDEVEEGSGDVEEAVEEVEGAMAVLEGEEEEKEAVKEPRKPRIKLGEIMGILNKRAIEASDKERPIPDIRTGDIVEIKLEVPENRRRLSVYKGIVISKQNAGIHSTIRIRRIIAGIGVEIVFPLYSPNIKEIKVVAHRKVRRARLYYLRDKLPRFSTFK